MISCCLSIYKNEPSLRQRTSARQNLGTISHQQTQSNTSLPTSLPPTSPLRVVSSSCNLGIASHGHVLDDDLRSGLAGSADPSGRGTRAAGDLEEVVGLSGGALPSLALIDGNLELVGSQVAVDDLRGEPVLGDAGLHVHLKRTGDRALNVVPGDIDDPLGGVGEGGEGGREKVEVVGAATGALVDDLPWLQLVVFWRGNMGIPYHSGNRFAVRTSDLDAATTLGRVGPVGVGESGSEDVRRESVGGERAGTTLDIAAVVCSLPRQSARLKGRTRGGGSEGCDGGDRSEEFELHSDRSAVGKEWLGQGRKKANGGMLRQEGTTFTARETGDGGSEEKSNNEVKWEDIYLPCTWDLPGARQGWRLANETTQLTWCVPSSRHVRYA